MNLYRDHHNLRTKHLYSHGFKAILREYWKNTHGFRYLLFFLAAGMCLDAFLQSSIVALLRFVIDKLIESPSAFIQVYLRKYWIYALLAGAAFFPFAYAGHMANSLFSSKLAAKFRIDLYHHLQKLSMDFFQRHKIGEIATRLTSDIENGIKSMSGFLTNFIWSVAMVCVSIVSMLLLSWRMFLVFLVLQLVAVAVSRLLLPKVRRLSRAVRENTGELNAQVTEDVSSMSLVKSFAGESIFFSRFREKQEQVYQMEINTAKISMLHFDIVQVLFIFIAPLLILGIGALMVHRTLITVGTLTAFWAYWKVIQAPISMLLNSMNTLYNSLASMDRVMEFFAAEPLVKDTAGAREFTVSEGRIEFRSVHFAYSTFEPKTVFKGLSLTIPAKSSLGIAGHSGVGKSTLVQLLLRFYDPSAGEILIDGQDIRSVKQEWLRSQFGVVMQDTILLAGTIRQNMLLGNKHASDKEICKALEMANAIEFIDEFEDGLDAVLGERGVNLSGGQKQRLAIARVFLKNPPIVIFDEATSSLDLLSERQIQESMRKLLQGRTSVIVAHRLSTIMGCDSIMVLDRGGIAGIGTHEELLNTCSHYADLVEISRSAMLGKKVERVSQASSASAISNGSD